MIGFITHKKVTLKFFLNLTSGNVKRREEVVSWKSVTTKI